MTVDRRLLPATFGPWFTRFQGLTEVQQQAIPPIVAGHDVLICSATASGKTEAYAAPGAELALRHPGGSATVVIISPTRALANDLKRRLEAPMGLVGVTLGRYTGEHKERVGGQLPAVIITTPEALDSMLARRPGTLRGTRLVVVDEVHVLDGTPRGDQLRILLHRLEAGAAHRPQRVAASATVDGPESLAARYLTAARVVLVPGLKKILGRPFHGRSAAHMAHHLDDLAQSGFKKILVFCRSRNLVETFTAKLVGKTRFGADIHAHHGSLAKGIRERTERLFQRAPAGVCFATLTLEMGIDIGTVDYVLLASLPSDVPSLLQRIGRGSRRGDQTRCGYVVDDPAEEHQYKTMFRLGKAGNLCGSPYGFRPSVLVQQALIHACAEGYVEAEDLEQLLPSSIAAELGPGASAAILEQMAEVGLVERAGTRRYVPSEEMEDRHIAGTLHSNIDEQPGTDVVDRITGDIVGSVQGVDSVRIEIGGRERKIVGMIEGRLLTDAGGGAMPARFRPSGSPSVSFALGRAVVVALDVGPQCMALVKTEGASTLLHGLGTIGMLFLLELLSGVGGVGARKGTPFTLEIVGDLPEVPPPTEEQIEAFVEEHLPKLSKLVSAGPWQHAVPDPLRRASVRRMTGLDEIANFLHSARIEHIEEPSGELLAILERL